MAVSRQGNFAFRGRGPNQSAGLVVLTPKLTLLAKNCTLLTPLVMVAVAARVIFEPRATPALEIGLVRATI